MLIIRDPDSAILIHDPDIRALLEQRFADMSEGEDYEVDLQVIVVEVADSVESLEQESGCPILHNLCDDIHYGQPGFLPSSEVLEEHASFYEMVFVPGDGDSGIVIIIPKQEGIDADLLAMCEEHAVPAP